MAFKTFGSNANNSLRAIQFNPSSGVMSDSDLALLNATILPNYGAANPNNPNSGDLGTFLSREGQFFIPGRGWVTVWPGDWLVVDLTTGWPFLLSAAAVASGPYTHS